MNLVKFMTSAAGRGTRILLGITLISIGQLVVLGTIGNIMSGIALIPILGGVLDFCLIGIVLGYPFSGSKAREQLAQEQA